jgi:two-component system, NtrC family, response regulator HydG
VLSHSRMTDGPAPTLRGRVLVVDDDLDAAEMIADGLRARGFRATPENDPNVALESAMDAALDVVVTDVQMRWLDGLALCAHISSVRPSLPVIVMTGHVSLDAAIGALRAGAFDFVTKPIAPELLALAVERAVAHHQLANEVRSLRSQTAKLRGAGSLLGQSKPMRQMYDVIGRVAPTQATVLVTGESGSGKELVARAIHEKSTRAAGPFVAINCAAVPANLLESELFGHEKGAFTDAQTSRRGLFLEASGGTLFLDEIGEMPMELQVKLLRALQEHRVRPVGGRNELTFDARVIAATHRDLDRDVMAKRFREDLYYRINVCSVEVPPLRDRESDVPALAQAFVQRYAEKHDKAVKGITAGAMARIVAYRWPGNVRELENAMERAIAMAQFDQVGVQDLPARIVVEAPKGRALMPTTMDELIGFEQLEREYIGHVLKVAGGNKSKAARILGLDRRTLYRKLEAWERGTQSGEMAALSVGDEDADDLDEDLASSG